ncbi:LOW QUALITY PROTEIN: forkhead box protein M1 [Anomaloglossus baeobatrachus]
MRSSPRRPLILRRRRLSLPTGDGVQSAGSPAQAQTVSGVKGSQNRTVRAMSQNQRTPEPPPARAEAATAAAPQISGRVPPGLSGVKVMGHPTIPDTQLVVMPPDSDVESIIQALDCAGRESGGPNKFILITGSSSLHSQVERLGLQSKAEDIETLQLEAAAATADLQQPPEEERTAPGDGQELDDSLTNIHWLGKMSSDGLGPPDPKTDAAEKENCSPEKDPIKVEEELPAPAASSSWPVSAYERPPYSYMALIQFAINSTDQRMTLKDIYTWIQDHFPYFRHVAKPGWKNSIRHNLSLHDMFVRESPNNNNKISYWTIHPQANRCLTLDQVFKASGSSSSACSDPPPRPVTPEPSVGQSLAGGTRAPERRMKPLLPRIDSYLIPVQFPLSQPLIFSPLETFTPDPGVPEGPRSSKRVKIAPKILLQTPAPPPPLRQLLLRPRRTPSRCRPSSRCRPPSRLVERSRRKQQLVTPRSQEPELLLPDSSASDSGLDVDFSILQDTQPPEGTTQLTTDEGYSFKTPVKDKFMKPPTSSTPSKLPCLQPWESPSLPTTDPLLDFSPVRIPRGAALTPFKDSFGTLSFWETPFKDLPYFGSPPDVMAALSPPSPQLETLETPTGGRKQSRCSKELQVGGSTNRSLLEGLVLDTKEESLSKILLDISFSGLEEEDPGATDASYWGQLFNELR